MFRLVPDDDNVGVVCHEGKPVAVREQLYHVLTSSHGQAQHGGRDKTSAQVRKYFSWYVSGKSKALSFTAVQASMSSSMVNFLRAEVPTALLCPSF